MPLVCCGSGAVVGSGSVVGYGSVVGLGSVVGSGVAVSSGVASGVGGSDPLWARRSLFWRACAPLQVTEVFLPALAARVQPTALQGNRP